MGTYTEPDYAAWLTAIDAQLLAWATGSSISSYSIAGRTFTKSQSAQLISFREYVYGCYLRTLRGNVTLADMSGRTAED